MINAAFSEARLSSTVQTNKLACCYGDGSRFDKHIDNQVRGRFGTVTNFHNSFDGILYRFYFKKKLINLVLTEILY